MGGTAPPISSWSALRDRLQQDYTVKAVDLASGRVPGDVDVLVLVAPQGMTDIERFAVDQFLMRGGAVVAAAGNFALSQQQMPGGLTVDPLADGLQEMLDSYGVEVRQTMVMDPRNEPFPVQVQRQAGAMSVIEIQELDYPFFVDVRPDSMDKESPIVSNLPAVTMQWSSPIVVDEAQNAARDVSVLLLSTEQSWLRDSTDIQPNTDLYPKYGFPLEGEQAARPLAVAIRGSFDSFFKGKASPFEAGTADPTEAGPPAEPTVEAPLGTIESSPETARLVVIGSAEFIDDVVLDISSQLSPDRYLNNLQFVQNVVDWSVEDQDLLGIRSRGTFARLLKPLEQDDQSLWEGVNYGLALVALVAIGGVWTWRRRRQRPMFDVGDAPADAGIPPDDELGGSDAQGGSDD
jgi:ABC-2 type transport system permease protein